MLVHPLAGKNGELGQFIEANDMAVERYGYSRDEAYNELDMWLNNVNTRDI